MNTCEPEMPYALRSGAVTDAATVMFRLDALEQGLSGVVTFDVVLVALSSTDCTGSQSSSPLSYCEPM